MKQHSGSHFSHALKMLLRNRRSYGLLSVTIVMSFAILLGYLCFTDSNLYDKYKVLFSAERNVVMAYSWDVTENLTMEKNVKADDPDCEIYHYYSTAGWQPQYHPEDPAKRPVNIVGIDHVSTETVFLPRGETRVYSFSGGYSEAAHYGVACGMPITPILGRTEFGLTGNEAIISESYYNSVNPGGTLPFEMPHRIAWKDGEESWFTIKVVGVCEDDRYGDGVIYETLDGQELFTVHATVYLSQEMMGDHTVEDFGAGKVMTWCRTDSPNNAAEWATRAGMVVFSASRQQDAAITDIQVQKATKGVIAIVLMLLLGINLYSSFTNALNERRFEIGVKRAMGASPWHIMLQFLMESLAVMLMNILLAMVVVADALALYKLYYRLSDYHAYYNWTMDVSSYSVAMFLVCSISLTVVFSFLFAWKSTRVEIVQYLKAE